MSQNAKNQLQELLQGLGHPPDRVQFQSWRAEKVFHARVSVDLRPGPQLTTTGQAQRRTEAEIAAAQAALYRLEEEHPEMFIDWVAVYTEAQAGDALIKLAAYLSEELPTPEDKSRYLQEMESDAHFVKLFDQWKAAEDPDLALLGPILGKKNKATYVEALIWRRFGQEVLSSEAVASLGKVLRALNEQKPG